jgi:hypothetical protein
MDDESTSYQTPVTEKRQRLLFNKTIKGRSNKNFSNESTESTKRFCIVIIDDISKNCIDIINEIATGLNAKYANSDVTVGGALHDQTLPAYVSLGKNISRLCENKDTIITHFKTKKPLWLSVFVLTTQFDLRFRFGDVAERGSKILDDRLKWMESCSRISSLRNDKFKSFTYRKNEEGDVLVPSQEENDRPDVQDKIDATPGKKYVPKRDYRTIFELTFGYSLMDFEDLDCSSCIAPWKSDSQLLFLPVMVSLPYKVFSAFYKNAFMTPKKNQILYVVPNLQSFRCEGSELRHMQLPSRTESSTSSFFSTPVKYFLDHAHWASRYWCASARQTIFYEMEKLFCGMMLTDFMKNKIGQGEIVLKEPEKRYLNSMIGQHKLFLNNESEENYSPNKIPGHSSQKINKEYFREWGSDSFRPHPFNLRTSIKLLSWKTILDVFSSESPKKQTHSKSRVADFFFDFLVYFTEETKKNQMKMISYGAFSEAIEEEGDEEESNKKPFSTSKNSILDSSQEGNDVEKIFSPEILFVDSEDFCSSKSLYYLFSTRDILFWKSVQRNPETFSTGNKTIEKLPKNSRMGCLSILLFCWFYPLLYLASAFPGFGSLIFDVLGTLLEGYLWKVAITRFSSMAAFWIVFIAFTKFLWFFFAFRNQRKRRNFEEYFYFKFCTWILLLFTPVYKIVMILKQISVCINYLYSDS